MILVTQFDIGDIVSIGPILEATVIGISYRSAITYDITYWNDRVSNNYTAWEWELTLVQKNSLKDN